MTEAVYYAVEVLSAAVPEETQMRTYFPVYLFVFGDMAGQTQTCYPVELVVQS